MTRTLAAVLLFSLTTAAFAQCENFKKDEFGGGVETLTLREAVGYNLVGIEYRWDGKNAEMFFNFKESGARTGATDIGQKLPFLMDDGEVLQLESTAGVPMKAQATSEGVYTLVSYRLGITKEQLQKMATTKVAKVRLPLAEKPFDWVVKGKLAKKIMSASSCLLNK